MNDRAEEIYFVKLLLDFVTKNRGKYPNFEEVINQLLKGNNLEKYENLTPQRFNMRKFLTCRITLTEFLCFVLA